MVTSKKMPLNSYSSPTLLLLSCLIILLVAYLFTKNTYTTSSVNMPLVTGQSTNPSNPTEEWQNKLVGKTLHDQESGATTFCKKDLPEGCRVIKPGTMVTKDFKEDRLNVHLDDEGIVTHVLHG